MGALIPQQKIECNTRGNGSDTTNRKETDSLPLPPYPPTREGPLAAGQDNRSDVGVLLQILRGRTYVLYQPGAERVQRLCSKHAAGGGARAPAWGNGAET